MSRASIGRLWFSCTILVLLGIAAWKRKDVAILHKLHRLTVHKPDKDTDQVNKLLMYGAEPRTEKVPETPQDVKEFIAAHPFSGSKADFERLAPHFTTSIDCIPLFQKDKQKIEEAVIRLKTTDDWTGFRRTEDDYIRAARSCDQFVTSSGYITSPLTELEEKFPLAFSLIVMKDIEQVARLLRAVYRPQNVYCLHVDLKADQRFNEALSAIASCFPNVYMAERIDVAWGSFEVLDVELKCMELLYNKSATWKYFINLTGQEFPLKTNRELVEILTAYNGANDVEGKRRRATLDYARRWEEWMPAPMSISPSKGAVHVVVTRGFVRYVLKDPRAKKLLDWVRPQKIPDETFFSTLNHNPHLGVPGSFIGLDDLEKMVAFKPYYGRYKAWELWHCAGERVRNICILSTGDLFRMYTSPYLFANKFHLAKDRLAYACLEQRIFNKTRDIHLGRQTVNTDMYKNSLIVKFKFNGKVQFH